jgi:hypothetical protein
VDPGADVVTDGLVELGDDDEFALMLLGDMELNMK